MWTPSDENCLNMPDPSKPPGISGPAPAEKSVGGSGPCGRRRPRLTSRGSRGSVGRPGWARRSGRRDRAWGAMLMDAAERERRIEAIAGEAFALFGAGRQVTSFASRYPGFGLSEAYTVAARVRDMRAARGETAIGRKIGFTNRAVQITYGVDGPIWNYMFDSTVHDLEAIGGRFDLSGLSEPRIEPEIAFHITAAPRPDMSARELIDCV